MSINKIEIQDGGGNVYYPKTSIDSVIYSNNISIEEKIQTLETKLNELKSQLANSINNKTGSSLTSNSTVDEMAAIINSIKTLEQATADANATAGNILVDKTAYVNGAKITGTMPEKGAFAQTLSANGTINLGSGHYDSIKITQSLNTRGATVWKPSTSAQSIPSGTYLTGTQTIQGDTNLAPQNIRAGVSIFGVGGALSVQSLGGKQYYEKTLTDAVYISSDKQSLCVNISLPFTPSALSITWYSPRIVWCPNMTSWTNSLDEDAYGYISYTKSTGYTNYKGNIGTVITNIRCYKDINKTSNAISASQSVTLVIGGRDSLIGFAENTSYFTSIESSHVKISAWS